MEDDALIIKDRKVLQDKIDELFKEFEAKHQHDFAITSVDVVRANSFNPLGHFVRVLIRIQA